MILPLFLVRLTATVPDSPGFSIGALMKLGLDTKRPIGDPRRAPRIVHCREEQMTAVQFARRRVALLLVALACSTLAVRPAFAQSMTGSLTGTIVDQTGA